jgi:eukaryotic-like serine/threonine-protein kinase
MTTPTAERQVANRYLLKAPLGRGGMGVVWRAHDAVLGREVAIKEVLFPPAIPEDERRSAQARVMREARAAARLNHAGAVTLYDVVQDQGHTFIVMELVSAPTLADLVRREGPLPPDRVAALGIELAGALEAAHRAGIVHRDVKPGNVMVPPAGPAKLADFGVASLQGDPQLTSTGLVIGSPAYMAPEQARGEESGPPADFWALGATLYYAVEGQPPFDRGASIPTLAAVVNDAPRPMTMAGPLGPVVAALLDKDPAARPTGPELRAELAAVAAQGTELLPPGEEAASTTATLPAQRPAGAAAAGAVAGAAAAARPDPVDDRPAPPADVWAPAWEDRAAEPRAELAPPPPPDVGRRGRGGTLLAGLAALLLVGLAAAWLVGSLRSDRGGGTASATTRTQPAGGAPATTAAAPTTTAGRATTTAAPTTTAPAAGQGQVPAGWAAITNRNGNWSAAVPPGWRANEIGGGNRTVEIEERDGARRAFTVRSRNPANPLPQASRDYRAYVRGQGWQEVAYDETATYAGHPAVVLEYLARESGRQVHVSHINFVGDRWGYNVMFTTPAEQWASSQQLAGQFEQSFRPLG